MTKAVKHRIVETDALEQRAEEILSGLGYRGSQCSTGGRLGTDCVVWDGDVARVIQELREHGYAAQTAWQ